MSLENQEQSELVQPAQKKFKISYTRDFLLSLSELDVCKKLPSGFDQSILSEFEDSSQDRFRISGGLSSQSYRHDDYSSSPPTRGDSSNYSRGSHGKWDSRSSGRSDRDSDSQSDWDSDSGRRYGNQSRRPWQVPEHDGLLGSGSFPRPSGYTTGMSGPKFRANEPYHLSRSNEPYHPPRPYKAVPHERRDTKDSYNDETFGSSDYTSEDRAEEERKRRASFELMRKEQHKSFQEKQKLNPEKGKGDFDISELLEDPKDDKRSLNRRSKLDEPAIQNPSNKDSEKSAFPSPPLVPRPLVPPGFSGIIVEKNIGTKPSTHTQPSELGNELEGSPFQVKGNRFLSGNSDIHEEQKSIEETDSREQLLGGPSIHISVNKKSVKILNLSLASDISNEAVDRDNQHFGASKLSEAFGASGHSEVKEVSAEDVKESKLVGESSPTHSTSILDKLFGSTLTLNGVGSSNVTKSNDVKADDTWSPHMVQSSKFAQWFHEEEKKTIDDISSVKVSGPVDDFSSSRPIKPFDVLSSGGTSKSVDDLSSDKPNYLLSLIAGGDKGGSSLIVGSAKSGSHDFDVKATENIAPTFPLQGSGPADGHVAANSMLVETIDKLEAVPAVLTCEDLEQSIISELTENAPTLQPSSQGWSGSAAKNKQKKAGVDNHASLHLLLLLQKGSGLPTDVGTVSPDRSQNTEIENLANTFNNSREMSAENISDPGKPLTLETLFGTAFMKELKSAGLPTSGQRDAGLSMRINASESAFTVMDDDTLALTADFPPSMSSCGSSALASNQRSQMMSERIGEQFLGFAPQNEVESSQLHPEFGSKLVGFNGSAEVRLPEEDSLIASNDPLDPQNFMSGRNMAKAELLRTPETAVDIAEKLAALISVYQDDRAILGSQEGPAIFRGSYDMREPDVQYHKFHAQPSSPQLHPSQLNHAGQMLHPLDSHPPNINAQMKYMAPDNIIHHDPPNHQFPANMLRPPFHHPSTGLTGLDANPHDPMLQQMHIPGNFPPHHLINGFPRNVPLLPHPNNQVPGFIQEPDPMQGFPFGQKQPKFGGLGIPQGADAGSGTHHPEVIQRLIEMELRSNAKQMHPLGAAGHGHSQGIYGHELDMSFGYR